MSPIYCKMLLLLCNRKHLQNLLEIIPQAREKICSSKVILADYSLKDVIRATLNLLQFNPNLKDFYRLLKTCLFVSSSICLFLYYMVPKTTNQPGIITNCDFLHLMLILYIENHYYYYAIIIIIRYHPLAGLRGDIIIPIAIWAFGICKNLRDVDRFLLFSFCVHIYLKQ